MWKSLRSYWTCDSEDRVNEFKSIKLITKTLIKKRSWASWDVKIVVVISNTTTVFISSSADSVFIYLKNTLVWGITKPMCNWNIFCINFALFKKKYRGDLSGWTAFADYYYMRELMLQVDVWEGQPHYLVLLLIRHNSGTIFI